MKKKIFAILFVFLTSFLFAQENEKIIDYMRNNGRVWSQNEEDNGLVYITYESLDDKFFFVIGNTSFRKSNRYLGFVTDGSKYFYDNYFSIQKTKHKSKYQWQDGLLSFFDYDFDSKKDFLYLYITIPYTVGIEIISPYYDCKSILSIELEDYGVDEYQLDWIGYCILSGKRGIRIRCRGKVHEGDYCYVADGGADQYAFFYWSPTEQEYILDESVTQEQIKNAYCPEDYFAYNGLKFSKLDSKLTAEDLRDLDKAQLRLMRNAVYARHGRTFKSVDLQSLWECYTWYKKNPNYNDSLLTDIDKYNIELIQKYEAHLSKFDNDIYIGKEYSPGEIVAYSGQSGANKDGTKNETRWDPHLHLSYYEYKYRINNSIATNSGENCIYSKDYKVTKKTLNNPFIHNDIERKPYKYL